MWNWLKHFLRGAGTVMEIMPAPQPSYEEQFGTDEELLAEDFRKIQEKMLNPAEN